MTKNTKIAFAIMAVITVLSIAAAFNLNSKLSKITNQPAADAAEVASIVSAVDKLIVLPPNETPTIATVSDPVKLKDQPFFKNSEVGDKVLIYSQSLKAILYRPSTNKIVEVSTLNVAPPQNAPAPAPAAKKI
jgi:hypothetical protein